MKKKLLLFIALLPLTSCHTGTQATDIAIFLFDNGEKNTVASMLTYAKEHDKETLDNLDFKIVFMGAAIDAMSQKPFCDFPDKLVDYKTLGITETIDRTWKRDAKISNASLELMHKNLPVNKKVFTGVACSVFGQILETYQKNSGVQGVALRDNPNPQGDTDYFSVAQQVQTVAQKIAVPAALSAEDPSCTGKEIFIVGHAPTEEWLESVKKIDSAELIKKLELNPEFPILAYGGVYGDYYEEAFSMFLNILKDPTIEPLNLQVIVTPHPRYKGSVEKKLCQDVKHYAHKLIIADNAPESTTNISTLQALAIANVAVMADATSTVVTQARALAKDVLYINPASSPVSQALIQKGILVSVSSTTDFVQAISESHQTPKKDIFDFFGMPRDGAKLLWEILFS